MRRQRSFAAALLVFALTPAGHPAWAQSAVATSVRPRAVVDLRTREGLALVRGEWRYHDASVVDVEHRSVGADLRPSGPPNRTHDILPKAGEPAFDDADWEVLDPATLEARRSSGRLSFAWYRLRVTIPQRLGTFDPSGAKVVFEIVVDDYAEVWVDGKLPIVLGQAGGPLIGGWNAPNRVVLTHDAQPGQQFEIAVFAANGPLSNPPGNYIWIRSATLDFHDAGSAVVGQPVATEVLRKDAALDGIVPADATIEKLAGGFLFTEGPVWVPDGGYLLFSDPNANTIYRWTPEGELSVFRTKSGYAGVDIGEYGQPGSNGLALDAEGRLTVAEHGRHRIARIEKNGLVTVLADAHQGKRLNSPNDLVYRSDGTLYFSDPPFGLPRFFEDARKELPYSGVFIWKDGRLRLGASDLAGPNGLAFSPDERLLYVTNWDEMKKVVMRYEVAADGALANGRVFFDMTSAPGEEALDGIEVDQRGNLYVSGPGGLWIISPEGLHLGTIRGPELAANFAWGDVDRRTLYLTARTGLYRIRLNVPGASPAFAAARAAHIPAERREPVTSTEVSKDVRVERLDARFDALVPRGTPVDRIIDGHDWLEGPAWNTAEDALYFSDIPRNAVYRWTEDDGESQYLQPSGYTGKELFRGREPGSNGLTFDVQGRLVLAQHGDRRIARLERDGRRTVLAERYEKRRLNSPNDVTFGPNGDLYFTDPPFGLPGAFDDPKKELPWQGVYRSRRPGEVELLTKAVRAPNGLTFSPDGRTLYVSNADRQNALYFAFPVNDDGTLGEPRTFFDATSYARTLPGGPDGMKTDVAGNLFAVGPGGVYVIAPDGTLLGRILLNRATSNVAWGGPQGSTLYITAGSAVFRINTATHGAAHVPTAEPSDGVDAL